MIEVGNTCLLDDCCREVRLGATPCHVGKVLCGWNTLTDQYEEWEVVTVNEKDHWKSIVRRLR